MKRWISTFVITHLLSGNMLASKDVKRANIGITRTRQDF